MSNSRLDLPTKYIHQSPSHQHHRTDLYRLGWEQRLRTPKYLSILSVVLCSFLLLSFLVLPAAQSHRHYLSIGLLIPVLLISLFFAIPVSTNPRQPELLLRCYYIL
jgi:hypothetical protein